jgi:hypothetical protein
MIGFPSSCSNRWPPSCSRKHEAPEILALYEAEMKKAILPFRRPALRPVIDTSRPSRFASLDRWGLLH